ncbi:hypothetical protein ACFSKU_21680 [Pontibacter silvestris]|uniref:Uncharacterized protein n=1 Tax=Pontibacter silvestris TaxID=2305183 RepID=A0ABW4X4B7_9BACT|nr:hypothetical protein [Pontibacter silvestris]MCC9138341.1 hypothetical protein [Pontibacter silvestris]
MEIRRFNQERSSIQEWLAMIKNTVMGLLGSYKAYQKFFTQFCINCNKGYDVNNLVPLMVDHVNARPVNRTNLSLLLYYGLRKLINPGFKITVTYGDNDIYGNSPKYIRKRYPTSAFVTITQSSHFAWIQNKKEFLNVLAEHYKM